MPPRYHGTEIALKRRGKRTGLSIERVVFDLAATYPLDRPDAVGMVNYRGSHFPIYRDEEGLFLEQTDEGLGMGTPLGRWGF